jgi:hypothetical protein
VRPSRHDYGEAGLGAQALAWAAFATLLVGFARRRTVG